MQALFPCIRRVSNLGFPLMFSLFFDLVDLGPTDLPLSPAMFSALRKEALGSFSYHLDCVARLANLAQIGYGPFKDL